MTLARSILIVEDDPKTAELIDRFLTKEGFRTTRAADGHAAIDAFAAVGPDLVILDVMLPKVDGFEVCALIRRTSKVPILFLTARAEEADLVLGLGLGADDYVAKPFSPHCTLSSYWFQMTDALVGTDPSLTLRSVKNHVKYCDATGHTTFLNKPVIWTHQLLKLMN